MRLRLAVLLLALGCAAFAAEAGADRPSAPPTLESLPAFAPAAGAVRRSILAQRSSCGGPGAYGWPVRPFDRPHPVRGNMGDPRTVYSVEGASFAFHNGVDVVAPNGTHVYPVVSGVAEVWRSEEVIVRTADGRSFQYWHVRPVVRSGQHVVARRTVLGFVRWPFAHVHLTEIFAGVVRNPLAPGHLAPYRDRTPPIVRGVSFRDAAGARVGARQLGGDVSAIVWAEDPTSLPVPGPWHGLPVSPARLTVAIETPSGARIAYPRTVFDFTHDLPEDDRFWQIYASGTYQNVPAIGTHLYRGTPGRYLYTSELPRLAPGSYRLLVTAADVCGNTGSLALPITVVAPTGPPVPPPLLSWEPAFVEPSLPPRAIRWQARRAAYTVVLASIPAAGGAAAAQADVSRALAARLPRVGVLDSTAFASLAPGYLVVFAGAYRTATEAAAAAFAASARYPGAYPRLIVPRAKPAHRRVAHGRLAQPRARAHARGAYAVVVASVPAGDGYAAARAEARRALDAGLRRARVVHSSAVSGLRPGFYVVLATGLRRGQAVAALGRVKARYPTAYARLLPRRSSAASSRRPCPPSPSASRSCTPSSGSALR